MPDCSDPGLSNPDGQKLARELLRPFLTHDIHDYILEGICKAIDGVHVLLVVKTGGGAGRHRMEMGMSSYTVFVSGSVVRWWGKKNINIHLTVVFSQDYLHC